MPNQHYDLESLSDGISHMPRRLTARERLADHVFFYLLITSRFVFIVGGIVGYVVNGLVGCVVLIGGGFLLGVWMRRSLGMRGPDQFHGYFRRIKERANGSRRGLLEWAIEVLRDSGYTISKCKAISEAYERAMTECHQVSSPVQQQTILQRLDVEVKRISYSN